MNNIIDGPSTLKPNIDYDSLNLNDMYALKMFLEKAMREKIFISHEEYIAEILHKKITNIINEIILKNKK